MAVGLRPALVCGAMALGACTPQTPPTQDTFRPVYIGLETRKLDNDLVNFLVEMKGARTGADVAEYAKCAAAQYALVRGFGFARHVRTSVDNKGGIWSGDAVYTVSPALPQGVRTIDAEVVVENCRDQGIPTV